jgi:CRISPR/Cas system Type II protein with McrA/HNH and RuvC-like nuclease domain
VSPYLVMLISRKETIECIWSGQPINDLAMLHVDHMIPFPVWENNNLWNLLPSSVSVNAKKLDRIPSPEFIEKRSDAIVTYWDSMYEVYPKRFSREIKTALIGSAEKTPGWHDVALDRLGEKCDYLIEIRGSGAWSLP